MIRLARGLVAFAVVAALVVGCSNGGGSSSGAQGTGSEVPSGSGKPSGSVTASGRGSPSSGPGRTTASVPAAWLTYHGDPGRSGFAGSPAPVHSLTVARRTLLDGPVYAQPVVAPRAGGGAAARCDGAPLPSPRLTSTGPFRTRPFQELGASRHD